MDYKDGTLLRTFPTPAAEPAPENDKEEALKVRNSIRSVKNQPGSQVVRRRGRIYVINKKNPRLKTRQG